MADAKTPWRKLVNLDYLGAYSLDNGRGGYDDIVVTIKSVRTEDVTGPDGKKESCMVMRFVENYKPMIVNSTNAKMIEKLTGSAYIEDWVGQKIQIGVEKVKAFGDMHDALRVRKFKPRDVAPKCNKCGKDIARTDRMTVAQVVEYTAAQFGLPVCADCARVLKAERDKAAEVPAETEAPTDE